MKKTLLFFAVCSILLGLSGLQTVQARPIEGVIVDDGGGDDSGTIDTCGTSFTSGYRYTSSKDSSLYCSIDFYGDTDYIKIYSTSNSMVNVYSTGYTDVKVVVYEGSYSSTPIAIDSTNNDEGEYYTDRGNFHTRVYMRANTFYYLKVSGETSSDKGSYQVKLEDCRCEHRDLNKYTLLTDTLAYQFLSAVTLSKKIYVYNGSNLYYDEVNDAIDEWNELGSVEIIEISSFTAVLRDSLGLKTLIITDTLTDQSYNGLYIPFDPITKYIFMDSGPYLDKDKTSYDKDKHATAKHELGHALGIDMDMAVVKFTLYGEDYFTYLVTNESDTNVMSYERRSELMGLGPCDIEVYYHLWGAKP